MIKRTADIELDVEKISDFNLDVDICKAQEFGGRRFLTGVASGVLEDADGERVSKNAIADMARQAVRGLKLVAGSHAQDWHNEIGDAVELTHDPEHDELLVKCELPPEGEDPLADKAWNRQTKYGEKLGFSIGGKLKSAYYELTDTGKKRKVLDGIGLKHFALTKKPSYRQSFALAVAKTVEDLAIPADDAFVLEAEPDVPGTFVAKMDGWVDPEADVEKVDGAAPQAAAAGNRGTKGKDTETPDVNLDAKKDDDKEPEAKMPEGGGERHLACPNCGHEFAAGMPADQDTPAEAIAGTDNDRDAHKVAPESEENTVLDKTIENLHKLAGTTGDDAAVEKTDKDAPAAAAADEPTAIEKMVAASHEANAASIEALEDKVAKAFEGVAELVKKTHLAIAELPRGRQSLARSMGTPTRAEVEAGQVAKTADDEPADVDEQVAKVAGEGDALKALATLNKGHYGIESNIAERESRPTELPV